jgi:DNA polymerase V
MYTAYDLSSKDPRWVRKTMTVVGERLVRELQEFSRLPLNCVEPDKQSIQFTRSFGVKLTEFNDIAEAVSTHATRLGEKLRKQNLVTPIISVFCRTSPFSNTPYYKGVGTIGFDIPTQDTPTLFKAAIKALGQAFKAGFMYQKAGIYAHDLASKRAPKKNSFSNYIIEASKRGNTQQN